MKKAVVLLSGGIDSTTTLYYAKEKGYKCFALIFDYGQRHKKELLSAIQISKKSKTPYKVMKIDLPWKGSSLIDKSKAVPKGRVLKTMSREIPSTYVPGRNTIFISFAMSYAEAIKANSIFIGANAVDYSGYPDCRPNYFRIWNSLIKRGTKAGNIKIITPLIKMTKTQIIKIGLRLKAPLHLTWSCYLGGKKPCGKCDSCLIRKKAFAPVAINTQFLYHNR